MRKLLPLALALSCAVGCTGLPKQDGGTGATATTAKKTRPTSDAPNGRPVSAEHITEDNVGAQTQALLDELSRERKAFDDPETGTALAMPRTPVRR